MKPKSRHVQFIVSAAVGGLALALALWFDARLAYSISANAFFVTFIGLTLAHLPKLTADYLAENAQEADEPILLIFLVTVAVIGVAIAALFLLLNRDEEAGALPLLLSLASIPLGWLTIHMMAALHYAHLYWLPGDGSPAAKEKEPARGLDFPATERPCGADFLYFATVIGMTAQTADIDITETPMRRTVMIHSILSFFFNTIIVAAAVNTVVALAN